MILIGIKEKKMEDLISYDISLHGECTFGRNHGVDHGINL